MSGVNKVILVGNLGAKPELKYTPDGVPVARFNIATTERLGVDDSGQKREHTEWHRITAWRKLAEICSQYLDKGSKVFIEGRIRTSKWVGKDGVQRYSTDIIADQMVMLSPKPGQREEMEEVPPMPEEYPSSSQKTSFPKRTPDEAKDIDLEGDDLDENFL